MIEFIIKYWLECLFGGLITILGAWCRSLTKKLKRKQTEYDALKAAMIAILHDKLFNICNQYLALGYIPAEKSADILDNARMIYEAYHALGGNGTGTTVYEKFGALNIKGTPEMKGVEA